MTGNELVFYLSLVLFVVLLIVYFIVRGWIIYNKKKLKNDLQKGIKEEL